jgi:hypothetical protein
MVDERTSCRLEVAISKIVRGQGRGHISAPGGILTRLRAVNGTQKRDTVYVYDHGANLDIQQYRGISVQPRESHPDRKQSAPESAER